MPIPVAVPTAPRASMGIPSYPAATMPRQVSMTGAHALWWGSVVAPALLAIAAIAAATAARRDLPFTFPRWSRMVAAMLMIGASGGCGHVLFAWLCHLGVLDATARYWGFFLAGTLTGAVAGWTIPYVCKVRAACFGSLAAIPMTAIFTHLGASGTSGDTLARPLLAATLAGFIAMALCMPSEAPDLGDFWRSMWRRLTASWPLNGQNTQVQGNRITVSQNDRRI